MRPLSSSDSVSTKTLTRVTAEKGTVSTTVKYDLTNAICHYPDHFGPRATFRPLLSSVRVSTKTLTRVTAEKGTVSKMVKYDLTNANCHYPDYF